MNVAHGVIDLVKVVLVVVGTCHAAQPAYHLFRVGLGREYLRLLYACVESQLVRRTLTQAALVGLVGIGWASELRIDLPEQIVTARLLLVALFGFHRPFKIGQRLGQLFLPEEQVSHRGIQLAVQAGGDSVASQPRDDISAS